jgi:hypothetical protein
VVKRCNNEQLIIKLKPFIMILKQACLKNALSIEDMESRYKPLVPGVLSFLTDSSCIDTQPPLPPGAGG